MASFVEQATLTIDDKATSKIRTINRELDKLYRNANRFNKVQLFNNVNTRGISNATRQVNNLASAINKVPRSRTVTFNVRQNGGLPTPPSGGGGTGGRPPGRGRNFFYGNADDGMLQAAGRIIARAFVATIGFDLRRVVNAAGRSGREAVVTIDTARINAAIGGIRDIQGFENAAFAAARETRGVSAGQIMDATQEAVGNLQAQLNKGAITLEEYNDRVVQVTRRVAETTQILGTVRGSFARGSEDARQIERSLAITGAGLDFDQQQAFVTAILNAISASGGDITGQEVRRTLQQYSSSLSQTLSPEGLARLLLIRDEGGRASTAEARMGIQELVRGSLNDADMAAQIAAGFRDAQGRTRFTEADVRDPVAFALREILPRVRAAGVNPQDTFKVQDFIDQQLGFTTSAARVFSTITTQAEQFQVELERFRTVNARTALEMPSVVAAVTDVNAAFQDLVARNAEVIVPAVTAGSNAISSTFESLTRGELPSVSQITGIAAAGAAASFAAIADPAARPLALAGLSLQTSAAALTASAVALGGAGVVAGVAGATGGKGIVPKVLATGPALLAALGIMVPSSTPGGYANMEPWQRQAARDEARRFATLSSVPPELREQTGEIARERSMDAFLNFDVEADKFRQTFETGSQQASVNITTGLQEGANLLTGGLANVFAVGADLIAQRITAAINNAVINGPRVSTSPPAADTGALAPTE